MSDTRKAYRELSPEEKANVARIKDVGDEMLAYLDRLPSSREISLAKTKIEEGVMWAVKGITA